MSSSTMIEVFGRIVFSFTRGVTEHYNPKEPEFTAESFGYDPLQSTGREWNHLPVDELIYQEYGDREVTSLDYLPSCRLDIRVINACSPEENEETQEGKQDEDRAMAWKRLRPSALRTVCKSLNEHWSSDFTAKCYHHRFNIHARLLYLLQNYTQLPFLHKEENSTTNSVDENNFRYYLLRFSAHVERRNYSISFPPLSVKRRENKTSSRLFSCVLFGFTLSCGSANFWKIVFRTFKVPNDSTKRFVSHQCMLSSLSSKASLPHGEVKKTTDDVFHPNDLT